MPSLIKIILIAEHVLNGEKVTSMGIVVMVECAQMRSEGGGDVIQVVWRCERYVTQHSVKRIQNF